MINEGVLNMKRNQNKFEDISLLLGVIILITYLNIIINENSINQDILKESKVILYKVFLLCLPGGITALVLRYLKMKSEKAFSSYQKYRDLILLFYFFIIIFLFNRSVNITGTRTAINIFIAIFMIMFLQIIGLSFVIFFPITKYKKLMRIVVKMRLWSRTNNVIRIIFLLSMLILLLFLAFLSALGYISIILALTMMVVGVLSVIPIDIFNITINTSCNQLDIFDSYPIYTDAISNKKDDLDKNATYGKIDITTINDFLMETGGKVKKIQIENYTLLKNGEKLDSIIFIKTLNISSHILNALIELDSGKCISCKILIQYDIYENESFVSNIEIYRIRTVFSKKMKVHEEIETQSIKSITNSLFIEDYYTNLTMSLSKDRKKSFLLQQGAFGMGKTSFILKESARINKIPIIISPWTDGYSKDILFLFYKRIKQKAHFNVWWQLMPKVEMFPLFIISFTTILTISSILLSLFGHQWISQQIELIIGGNIMDYYKYVYLFLVITISYIISSLYLADFLLFRKDGIKIHHDYYIDLIFKMLANDKYLLVIEDLDRLSEDSQALQEAFGLIDSLNKKNKTSQIIGVISLDTEHDPIKRFSDLIEKTCTEIKYENTIGIEDERMEVSIYLDRIALYINEYLDISLNEAGKSKIREKIKELKLNTPNFRVIHDMKEKIICQAKDGGHIIDILEGTVEYLKSIKKEKDIIEKKGKKN